MPSGRTVAMFTGSPGPGSALSLIEPSDLDARQLFERVAIARHRPFHEIPLHRVSTWRNPAGRALVNKEPGRALSVPELSCLIRE